MGFIAVAFRAVRRVVGGRAKDTLPPLRLVSECKERGGSEGELKLCPADTLPQGSVPPPQNYCENNGESQKVLGRTA